jgi:uncharacterized protein YlxW (UPF0749 family)
MHDTEQCGSSIEENQEALEQNYEEKLKTIEVQHQSQLSKISPCIIFNPHVRFPSSRVVVDTYNRLFCVHEWFFVWSPTLKLTSQYIALKIVYSIDALQSLIEEEKQEALTQLGEHYQTQLQSLQEHISDLQKRLNDANKQVCRVIKLELSLYTIWTFSPFGMPTKSSQRQQELNRLEEVITQQEEQLEELRKRSGEDQSESNKDMSSSRRHSCDESTASTTESSGEDDYHESAPPNG